MTRRTLLIIVSVLTIISLVISISTKIQYARAAGDFACTAVSGGQLTDRTWYQRFQNNLQYAGNTVRDINTTNQKFLLFYNGGTAQHQILWTDTGTIALIIPTSGNATIRIRGNYYNGIFNPAGSTISGSWTNNTSEFDVTGVQSVCGYYNVNIVYNGSTQVDRKVRQYFPYVGSTTTPDDAQFANVDDTPPSTNATNVNVTNSSLDVDCTNCSSGGGGGITADEVRVIFHDYALKGASLALAFAVSAVFIYQFRYRSRR